MNKAEYKAQQSEVRRIRREIRLAREARRNLRYAWKTHYLRRALAVIVADNHARLAWAVRFADKAGC